MATEISGGNTTCYDSRSSGGNNRQIVENERKERLMSFLKWILPQTATHAIANIIAAISEKIGNKENAGQTKEPSITDQGNGTKEKRKTGKKSEDPLSPPFSEEIYEKQKPTQMSQSSPSDQVKTTKDSGNILKSAGIILVVVVAIAGIFVAVFISTLEPEMKSDFDLVTIFGNGVEELQQSFTNQTERFWMILKNRGLAHLRNKHPTQPLVFLLAAPPPAHEWVNCLATKLAEKLDPKQKRNLATIDGNQEKGNSADNTKEKMDEILEENFKAGHRVALIHHLELLPPPSPLLFYSYCDDQNAPYKHATIIFTVSLPEEPSSSLSPKEAEGVVEEYLANEVWSKVDEDAVSALLSRIATTVALMNGEPTNSLKAYCS